jgi:hypothetical protein
VPAAAFTCFVANMAGDVTSDPATLAIDMEVTTSSRSSA